MSASGTVTAWICAALAAFPLSPCAFFTSVCRGHDQQATVEAEAAPAGSCCARHDKPASDQSQPRREPCQGECCQISPFVLAGDKLVPDSQPALVATVLPLVDDVSTLDVAPLAIAVGQPLSLNILHCRWRC